MNSARDATNDVIPREFGRMGESFREVARENKSARDMARNDEIPRECERRGESSREVTRNDVKSREIERNDEVF